MQRKVSKQNALSLKTRMELKEAVDKRNLSKTEILKNKTGMPNSAFSTTINNGGKS
jgi:hypothetical protein